MEVVQALKDMSPTKSPGSDGFMHFFFFFFLSKILGYYGVRCVVDYLGGVE